MESINKEISNKLYVLTFIMTIAIVIFHCVPGNFNLITSQVYPFSNFISNYVYNLYDDFSSIALGFFFAQTGFFLYNNLTKDNIRVRFKKRLKSLLVPFVFWNLFFFIVYIVLDMFADYKFSLNSLIGGFSFLPFDGPLWYVFTILVLLFFLPLLQKIKDKKVLQIVLFIISIGVAIYVSLYPGSWLRSFKYYFCIERAIRYIPAYLFGAGIAMNKSFKKIFDSIFNNGKFKYIFILLFILNTFTWCINLPQIASWFITRISPLFVFGMIDCKKIKTVSDYFKFTFLIYALHYMVKDLLFKYVFNNISFANNILVPIFIPILVAFVAYLICLLIFILINKLKFRNKVWMIMTGGRC